MALPDEFFDSILFFIDFLKYIYLLFFLLI